MIAQRLKIGVVAKKTGLTVDAIRFYERAGLLPRPSRTSSGYRVYGDHDVADLEFIQKAQQLGFSLKEINELISIQRHPQEACIHVRDLIEHKLTAVRDKIEELRQLQQGLEAALTACRKALRQSPNHQKSCPVLNEIRTSRHSKEKRS